MTDIVAELQRAIPLADSHTRTLHERSLIEIERLRRTVAAGVELVAYLQGIGNRSEIEDTIDYALGTQDD